MDDKELEKLRAHIRFLWACDGIALSGENVELCVQASLRAREELERGGSRENQALWERARARAAREGLPLGRMVLEEVRARHAEYWEEKERQNPAPKTGETAK